MIYEKFLENLKQAGFNVVGLSYAFREFGDWQISFIRFGGKYQSKGKISFVICARSIYAKGLEGKIIKQSTNPHDYPFKLSLGEIIEKLKYKPKPLNFSLEEFERDGDWTKIYDILLVDLTKALQNLGVDELNKQIRSQEELSYIEKIWLEN